MSDLVTRKLDSFLVGLENKSMIVSINLGWKYKINGTLYNV